MDHFLHHFLDCLLDRLPIGIFFWAAAVGSSLPDGSHVKTFYTDPTGRKRKMYDMTQKGFLAIAMGFSGPDAAVTSVYQASLPIYHQFTHEVKALIEYAVTHGANRQDVDPEFYKLFNSSINKAVGIKCDRRKFNSPTATVHIRNLNRLIKKTIRRGIERHQFFATILSDTLDAITDYSADNIDADERKRFSDFADANKDRLDNDRFIDRARKQIAAGNGHFLVLNPAKNPPPDPDYDFEPDSRDDDDDDDDDRCPF